MPAARGQWFEAAFNVANEGGQRVRLKRTVSVRIGDHVILTNCALNGALAGLFVKAGSEEVVVADITIAKP